MQYNIPELTEQQYDSFKSEHPRALALAACGYQFVLRPMTRAEYDKMGIEMAKLARENRPMTSAMVNAVTRCLLFPSVQEFNDIISEYPALPATLSEKLAALAGSAEEAVEINFR